MSERHISIPAHEQRSPQLSGDFFVQETKSTPEEKSIVITGGPSTGKTTVIKHLQKSRPDLEYIDEAATMVLSGGFPMPSSERPWSQTWQNALQIAVAGMQLGLEATTREHASTPIIQDRGLLDGASYLQGGVGELEDLIGMDRRDILNRYHAVIYLGWLTTRSYTNNNNPQRFEDEHRAQQLSERVRLCWDEHPRLIEVTNQNNRAATVSSLLPALIEEEK